LHHYGGLVSEIKHALKTNQQEEKGLKMLIKLVVGLYDRVLTLQETLKGKV